MGHFRKTYHLLQEVPTAKCMSVYLVDVERRVRRICPMEIIITDKAINGLTSSIALPLEWLKNMGQG